MVMTSLKRQKKRIGEKEKERERERESESGGVSEVCLRSVQGVSV